MLYSKIVFAIFNIRNNRNVFVLKFEDLTDKPEESIKDVCKFLNIPFNESLIENVSAPSGIIMAYESWKRKNIIIISSRRGSGISL